MRLPFAVFVSALALALAACSPVQTTFGEPASAQAPVTVSQSQLASVGKAVLVGVESAAANYVLSSGLTPEQQTDIVKAEVQAENDINKLSSATPTLLSSDLIAAKNSLQAFVSTIPAGHIPASVTAGISAFTVVVDTVAPLIASPPVVPTAPDSPAKTSAVKLAA